MRGSLAVALGVLAFVSAPSAHAQDLDALRYLEGVWRYADGRDGERRIDEAVARAVDDMPFFLEGIARGRIRARTYPHQRVRFDIRGDRVLMSADDWGPVGSRPNGPAVRIVGPEGDRLRFTQSIARGRLLQRYWHPDGERINEFSLSGDRQWLWISVTIRSPRLPDEVRFRLRYRRTAGSTQIAARDPVPLRGPAPRGEEHAQLDPRTQRPLPRE